MNPFEPAPSAFTVGPDEGGPLLEVLVRRFPRIPEAQWRARCEGGLVSDDSGTPLPPEHPCRPGQRIRYARAVPNEPEPAEDETIVFEDDHLLVADKPHRMAVTPGGRNLRHCLVNRLRARTGLTDLSPVHRLDRDTAGLVLFAKTPEALAALGRAFDERRVAKVYEALATVPGSLEPRAWRVENRLAPGEPFFTMRVTEGAPNAVTEVALLEIRAGLGRFRLVPLTGRKHQLRVHLASLGFPILHDPFYPTCRSEAEAAQGPPLQLLAAELHFRHPATGEPMAVRTERVLVP